MQTKICTTCKTKKPLSEFGKRKAGRFGVRSICKICTQIRDKAWRLANPEKPKAASKKWRESNREKCLAQTKAYAKANPKKIKAYCLAHKEKIKATNKAWSMANKERRNLNSRRYRKNNPEKCKLHDKNYYNRHKTKHSFRLKNNISGAIRQSLTGNKNGRSWEKLVGYNLEQLKKHLEKQFTKDMTWELYVKGKIHIDHIIPISVHNFEKPEDDDFKKCWALKNLQPLWAKDNLEKHAKLTKHFQPSLML